MPEMSASGSSTMLFVAVIVIVVVAGYLFKRKKPKGHKSVKKRSKRK